MPKCLRRIDEEGRPSIAGNPANFRHRLNCPSDIRGMDHRDQLRFLANRDTNVVGIHQTRGIAGDARYADAMFFQFTERP